jgi:hypothetical protein
LLSDKILAAGSFYFESEITRQVTERLEILFEEGEILYFIDDNIEDFEEHGAEKILKSPTSFEAYNNKDIVKARAKKLNSLYIPLRRPPSSISDKIVSLWLKDLYSCEEGTLGYLIDLSIIECDKKAEIKLLLYKYAVERKKDFVWEYLHPFLYKLKLSKHFQNSARKRLSQLYSIATSELLGVSLDNNDLPKNKYLSRRTKYDTYLFEECMRILGLKEVISKMEAIDLIKLKTSPEFINFKEFYFTLVEAATLDKGVVKQLIPLFVEAEQVISTNSINIETFINSFAKMCSNINISHKAYGKSLDIILNRFQVFNKATIKTFIDLVNETLYGKIDISKKTNNIRHSPDANEFYIMNKMIIDKTINDKFKIPKTSAPGRFEEMIIVIIKWLDNFRKSEYELALEILQKVNFKSESCLNELICNMSNELKNLFANDLSKVNFFGLGNSGASSGDQFLYKLKKELQLNDNNFPNDYHNISDDIQSIVFIDDMIGSGKQATDYYNNNLTKINAAKYYCSLFGYESGIERIKKNAGYKYIFTMLSGAKSFPQLGSKGFPT